VKNFKSLRGISCTKDILTIQKKRGAHLKSMLKKRLSDHGKRYKITKTVQKPSKKFGLNRNRQEWGENKKIALIP
jgi:hypothetical protein